MAKSRNLAVVTGGGSGIGSEICEVLVDHGWDIAIGDIHDRDYCAKVIDVLEAKGAKVYFQQGDVGSADEVNEFYKNIEKAFGYAPHLLVNNAGCQTWSSLLDLQEKDWDRVINTNLKGTFLNTQAAAKLMVKYEQPGSIVNIGSGCNQRAFPKLVDYAASKGGVEMFTKVAAVELGEHQIRVNCVAPGGILIERTKLEADDYETTWAGITPLQRVGFPKDIANAVLFFASSQADFVTGQTLFVDGGAFSKSNWPY